MQWRNWTYRAVRTNSNHHSTTAADDDDDDDNNNHHHHPEIEDVEADTEKDGGSSASPWLSRALRNFQIPCAQRASHSFRSASDHSVVPWTTTAAAVVFLVLFVFMPRPWLAADHPPQLQHFNCGNSTQDAAAAGCKFDLMSYTWVHPDCFDQQLMYEFLGADTWTWAMDEDSTELLNLNDVAMGQHEFVYVTWKHYTMHCAYMWRKMHRSILTSRELDSYVSDYRHTEKCATVLLDRERDLESTSVMLVAKYPSCPVVSQ
ncbi:hypothetical protein BD289DRAFT_295458 [Coniella lustricola]|uniref:Uncharacterized protein n=1 Tax=Coniella lustricola TaxID=2025994 RepID=A0A2T3A4U0_9PEZI|nr:hypothetical protein BD289DRAFT_295458 [Coniella lustricola]